MLINTYVKYQWYRFGKHNIKHQEVDKCKENITNRLTHLESVKKKIRIRSKRNFNHSIIKIRFQVKQKTTKKY